MQRGGTTDRLRPTKNFQVLLEGYKDIGRFVFSFINFHCIQFTSRAPALMTPLFNGIPHDGDLHLQQLTEPGRDKQKAPRDNKNSTLHMDYNE